MLRLKSRTTSPPGGFLYEQKQTGWRNWLVAPTTQWDFNALCAAIQAHRQANPRFGLKTDLASILLEVDTTNAERVAAIPNAESYIINDQGPAPFPVAPVQTNRLQQFVAEVKAVSAGAETVLAFEKSGDSPVPKEHSEARALVCSQCPQNGKGGLTRWFTVPISELIRKQFGRLSELGLSTSLDDRLGVCEACSCPLKLKVHFPMKYVLEGLTPEIRAKLQPENPRCWILQEDKA
jgi:hypothetical protein